MTQTEPALASPLDPAEPTDPPARRAPGEACWRELMAVVLDGPLSAEARLEALMDHIERGAARR